MSKANAYEADLLKLLLNATPIANVADNAASSPLTNLYVSLHTADPADTGDQTTSEVTTGQYGQYVRKPVLRNNGTPAWTISGTNPTVANPNANIDFDACTTGSGTTATHMGIGSLVSGAGRLFYSGAISPQIVIGVGVTPRITTATAVSED